jgi:hypothetical protein
MYDERPIHPAEARELCEQMLIGVRELPPSAEQSDYLALYTALARGWVERLDQRRLW